ncbi:hypothetical protein H5410_047422 [Solanum commersonii]|uniref:Uncharacterized protein n=1 Tax=Solanum commersonii TaxID=4109 RepID=A0A9J5XI89_SOLCO|nr:hypothetical protein H5410_047422 [Solanum commersonii]
MKKKGKIKHQYWNPEEEKQLQKLIEKYGAEHWSLICQLIPNRSGKSCRLRWCDQHSPQIDDQPFTPKEDDIIIKAYAKFSNQWALIAHLLLGQTNNMTKNYWKFTLKRKHPYMTSTNPGSLYESNLSNLDFSKSPQLFHYPPVAPPGRILPLSVISPIMSNPPTYLSPFEYDLSILVMSDPSTSLILSLPRFRSSNNLNWVNQIEQVVQLTLVLSSEPTINKSLFTQNQI